MPFTRVPLVAVDPSADDRRRQARELADELAGTALDLREPAAVDAVADLVAAVHTLLVRP